jgi:hypothetical protein
MVEVIHRHFGPGLARMQHGQKPLISNRTSDRAKGLAIMKQE